MSYTRLNPCTEDSGWVRLWHSSGKATGCYRKVGNIVTLYVSIGGQENITVNSSGVLLGTLPEGYRPNVPHGSAITVPATIMTNGSAQINVNNDGTVMAYNFATAGIYFRAAVSFPVG